MLPTYIKVTLGGMKLVFDTPISDREQVYLEKVEPLGPNHHGAEDMLS